MNYGREFFWRGLKAWRNKAAKFSEKSLTISSSLTIFSRKFARPKNQKNHPKSALQNLGPRDLKNDVKKSENDSKTQEKKSEVEKNKKVAFVKSRTQNNLFSLAWPCLQSLAVTDSLSLF